MVVFKAHIGFIDCLHYLHSLLILSLAGNNNANNQDEMTFEYKNIQAMIMIIVCI